MPQSLYTLALLACPLGMGLMMWMMMRGNRQHASRSGGGDGEPGDRLEAGSGGQAAELARLRREIDQLQSERAGAMGPRTR